LCSSHAQVLCCSDGTALALQETSGLANSIDYFVSFDDIEPDNGNEHYSEQLVRLKGFHNLFTYPMHLHTPVSFRSHILSLAQGEVVRVVSDGEAEYVRAGAHNDAVDRHLRRLGMFGGLTAFQVLWIPDAIGCGHAADTGGGGDASGMSNATVASLAACSVSPLYLCPQTLYKLHPVFDAVISRILSLDECGTLMLLHGTSNFWDVAVLKRIADQLAFDAGAVPARHSLFNETIVSVDQRCRVLRSLQPSLERLVISPQRGHNSFMELLASADVVVDSYPFGEPAQLSLSPAFCLIRRPPPLLHSIHPSIVPAFACIR
jgi:hypothetical protein